MSQSSLGLYVHIPYCSSKCYYCDFYSAAQQGVPQEYVQALLREMRRFANCPKQILHMPETLYFGGGTPSLLTPEQLALLIEQANPMPDAEITLECNPEHLTLPLAKAFRAAGVNRISFGVQSASDASLQRLGRRHTAQQARAALQLAQKAGFTNICGDMMLALPHDTIQQIKQTADLLAQGGCTHISAYLLKLEEKTVFGKQPPDGLPNEDEAAEFYLQAVDYLHTLGYRQYEISNFCREGFEAKHNTRYWTGKDYLGIGPSAASCIQGKRFYTPAKISRFLQAKAEYQQDGTCCAQDDIMLRLRLTQGLCLEDLRLRWGLVFCEEQLAFFKKLAENGLAFFDGAVLRLTPRGFLLQNSILCEIFYKDAL